MVDDEIPSPSPERVVAVYVFEDKHIDMEALYKIEAVLKPEEIRREVSVIFHEFPKDFNFSVN
jgi:hypothetical protein